MKMLITATTTLLSLGLFASTASARPGDGPDRGDRGERGDRWAERDQSRDGYDNDSDGYVDEYNENTTYAYPEFERESRHGRLGFHQVKRFMRARMMERIAMRAQQIHARFGYGRFANHRIARMEQRERARFQARLAWARTRFDQFRSHARSERRGDARRANYVYAPAQVDYQTW